MKQSELQNLPAATGLSYRALASLLDTDERSLSRWLSGERKPRHPAMLRRALQLIVLEQRGVITERMIDHTEKEAKK